MFFGVFLEWSKTLLKWGFFVDNIEKYYNFYDKNLDSNNNNNNNNYYYYYYYYYNIVCLFYLCTKHIII